MLPGAWLQQVRMRGRPVRSRSRSQDRMSRALVEAPAAYQAEILPPGLVFLHSACQYLTFYVFFLFLYYLYPSDPP